MNVLRYCNLDESLQGEESLISRSGLDRLYKTKELDYMSYIVLRMFENVEVRAFIIALHMPLCKPIALFVLFCDGWMQFLTTEHLLVSHPAGNTGEYGRS